MTLAWLVIWFVCNLVGGHEPLHLDPVNGWTGTLILAVALDLARPLAMGDAGARGTRGGGAARRGPRPAPDAEER